MKWSRRYERRGSPWLEEREQGGKKEVGVFWKMKDICVKLGWRLAALYSYPVSSQLGTARNKECAVHGWLKWDSKVLRSEMEQVTEERNEERRLHRWAETNWNNFNFLFLPPKCSWMRVKEAHNRSDNDFCSHSASSCFTLTHVK